MADSSRKKEYFPHPWESVGIRGSCGGFVSYVYLVRLGLHVDFGPWRVGAEKEGRRPRLTWRRAILGVKSDIYRYVGLRSDPAALRWCRILFFYFVRLVFYVDEVNGGGRWVGAKKEGRLPRLTRKWRILVVKREIYRPAGAPSDPRSFRSRRNFVAYLVPGGGIWCVLKKQQLAVTQKSRELAVNIIYPLISGPIGKISPIRSFSSLTGGDFSPGRSASKGFKIRQNDRKSRLGPPPTTTTTGLIPIDQRQGKRPFLT